jgi:hypothetical protein
VEYVLAPENDLFVDNFHKTMDAYVDNEKAYVQSQNAWYLNLSLSGVTEFSLANIKETAPWVWTDLRE